MKILSSNITADQVGTILTLAEGQFLDLKAKEIAPAKLAKHVSAFANSDGGELYVGIEERKTAQHRWSGFASEEDANGLVQTLQNITGFNAEITLNFLRNSDEQGSVLQVTVVKSRNIIFATDGTAYVRRGAQSIPLKTHEELRQLEFTKGITSFEAELTDAAADTLFNSLPLLEFLVNVVPTAEPQPWLSKQLLIRNDRATVGGITLFSEEPQAVLPKHCGIKLYRYKTKEEEGTRESLAFDPITVEGPLYNQIGEAVARTTSIIEDIPILGEKQLEKISYPPEALHEIITNAVLHRDYSIADDVHIRIFDNRVEVQSPGRLPGHITVGNILEERFARNGTIVRILNKFPDPPNKDVGEGLNIAFAAMKKLGLKEPVIEEIGNNVLVTIRHEPLASPEEAILDFLKQNTSIKNSQAQEITYIQKDYMINKIFRDMVKKGMIEKVPGTRTSATAYRLPTKQS